MRQEPEQHHGFARAAAFERCRLALLGLGMWWATGAQAQGAAVNDLPGGPGVRQLDLPEPVTKIAAAQRELKGWPGLSLFRANSEKAMLREDPPPQTVIAAFGIYARKPA